MLYYTRWFLVDSTSFLRRRFFPLFVCFHFWKELFLRHVTHLFYFIFCFISLYFLLYFTLIVGRSFFFELSCTCCSFVFAVHPINSSLSFYDMRSLLLLSRLMLWNRRFTKTDTCYTYQRNRDAFIVRECPVTLHFIIYYITSQVVLIKKLIDSCSFFKNSKEETHSQIILDKSNL